MGYSPWGCKSQTQLRALFSPSAALRNQIPCFRFERGRINQQGCDTDHREATFTGAEGGVHSGLSCLWSLVTGNDWHCREAFLLHVFGGRWWLLARAQLRL